MDIFQNYTKNARRKMHTLAKVTTYVNISEVGIFTENFLHLNLVVALSYGCVVDVLTIGKNFINMAYKLFSRKIRHDLKSYQKKIIMCSFTLETLILLPLKYKIQEIVYFLSFCKKSECSLIDFLGYYLKYCFSMNNFELNRPTTFKDKPVLDRIHGVVLTLLR